MTTLTRQLVRFATQLQINDLPAHIQHKVQLHLLDAIACGWAGSRTALAHSTHAIATALGGAGNCMVFGSRNQTTAMIAAFANASIINALDHDDGVEINGKGLGHPGATLIAAAMAAIDQQSRPVSTQELVCALAAGFEINNRLIHALQPSAERFAQVYGIAQHQAIGAAIVYGKLCRFDENTLHHAIGLAATLTCVPSLHKYNWQDRPLATLKDGVATAAQAGVQAAIMAQAGMIGSRDVLDGPQGYWRMVGSDRFAPDIVLQDLGTHWYIQYGSFKRYPACRWLACALECMEAIVQSSGIAPDDIAHIQVETFAKLANDLADFSPVNPTDAQFSLPYTLAAVALQLPPGEAWFTDTQMASPKLRALAAKVQIAIDPELDARMSGVERQPGARVIVVRHDGVGFEETRTIPLGGASRPMTDDAVIDKARSNLTGKVHDPESVISALLNPPLPTSMYAHATAVG